MANTRTQRQEYSKHIEFKEFSFLILSARVCTLHCMAAFFELPLEDVQWQEGLSHSVDECPDCSGENSGVTQPKYDKNQALQIAGIQVRVY